MGTPPISISGPVKGVCSFDHHEVSVGQSLGRRCCELDWSLKMEKEPECILIF